MSPPYEFSTDQNRLFARVARNARLAGVANLVATVAVVAATVKLGLASGDAGATIIGSISFDVLMMTLTVLYGVWLIRAAAMFSKVVTTQGNDIAHMLDAFRELTKVYRTQQLLLLVGLSLALAIILFPLIPLLLVGAVMVLTIASMAKIFTKAGKPGLACVIPIYNTVLLVEIAGKPRWWIALCFIPFANLVAYALIFASIARAFGRHPVYAIGLLLVPWVFFPMLAFNDSEYHYAATQP